MFSDFSKQFSHRELESSVKIPEELAKQVLSEIDVLLSSNPTVCNKSVLDHANTSISDLKLLRQQYVDTACSVECNYQFAKWIV